MHYALEAVVVGVVMVLASYFSVALVKRIIPSPEGDFNKYRVMESSVFLAGVVTHVLFEKCTSGHACRSLHDEKSDQN